MNVQEEIQFEAVKRCGAAAIALYHKMRSKGETPKMAAMLATRKAPGTGVDDRMVFANAPSVTEQFKGCPEMLALYRKKYREKTGEDLPEDAVVYRSLVSEPGDPEAIVTHKHSLAEVKEAMRRRNAQVEGDWEIHPVQAPPQPQVCRISDMAMARYKAEYRMEEQYRDVDERDIEAEIIHRHTKVVTADDVMNAPRTIDEAYSKAVAQCSSPLQI